MTESTPLVKTPLVKTSGDRVVQVAHQPWSEKYRPKVLDEVAAHKDIIDTSAYAYHTCFTEVSFLHLNQPCINQNIYAQVYGRCTTIYF